MRYALRPVSKMIRLKLLLSQTGTITIKSSSIKVAMCKTSSP